MPSYTPIDLPMEIEATHCKIDGIRWIDKAVHINVKTRKGKKIRVAMKGCLVLRHLDGIALTDLEYDETTGIKPNHLLYEVGGACFLQQNVSLQRRIYGEVKHYRLITLRQSVDVLATMPPVVTELNIKAVE